MFISLAAREETHGASPDSVLNAGRGAPSPPGRCPERASSPPPLPARTGPRSAPAPCKIQHLSQSSRQRTRTTRPYSARSPSRRPSPLRYPVADAPARRDTSQSLLPGSGQPPGPPLSADVSVPPPRLYKYNKPAQQVLLVARENAPPALEIAVRSYR